MSANIATPDSGDRLSFTLFAAAALHALLIFGVTFKVNQGEQVAPTLNITLANHRSNRAPEKADFLAQYNQEASGTEQEVRELSTTSLSPLSETQVNEVSPVPKIKKAVPVENQTMIISTTAQVQNHTPLIVDPSLEPDVNEESEGQDDEAVLRSEKFASLQAKLDKIKQEMAREPRVTRHTSVSAKASDEAEYYNRWSEKIIRVGNNNFPKEALKNKIFGSLRLSVRIKADGTVSQIELLESSGHKLLDDAAVRIVRLSSPFDPFPPEIRKKTDIFEIIRTWEFEITGLTTR
jgi:protein TonB